MEYWKFLVDIAVHYPRDFAHGVAEAIKGHHLITRTQQALKAMQFRRFLQQAVTNAQALRDELAQSGTLEAHFHTAVARLEALHRDQLRRASRLYRKVHEDFRPEVLREYQKFQQTLQGFLDSLTPTPVPVPVVEEA